MLLHYVELNHRPQRTQQKAERKLKHVACTLSLLCTVTRYHTRFCDSFDSRFFIVFVTCFCTCKS